MSNSSNNTLSGLFKQVYSESFYDLYAPSPSTFGPSASGVNPFSSRMPMESDHDRNYCLINNIWIKQEEYEHMKFNTDIDEVLK